MAQLTTKDIIVALTTQAWTPDEINNIIAGVKYARSRLAHVSAANISVGDRVKWTSSRSNRGVMSGQVIKINRTRFQVKVGQTTWNVPKGMVELDNVKAA
jgi:hypothetical protein